ncbi:hypothetical protein BU23DRAFT_210133 [Bimuria novae-zelandiae CBS 107.79]|uniref:Uncharacterized protein n=1 Tax=Bimuria novae-zelandiae CBS 107.79 TaxID=1447943 RepID=A0A6A5V1L9_9PLEO|nr:hypothetical protein BU23DRAFT_210133 [Bimuria novae-zelandiae CBS 107.79]
MPEETSNGDYEYITYRTYDGVGFERLMSWKGGAGRVSAGRIEMKPLRSDLDTKDEVLPQWHSVIVDKMSFKLVRKN